MLAEYDERLGDVNMKCGACGYEKGHKYDEESNYIEVNPNGEEFIKINGHFTVTEGDYHQYEEKVGLYACPECKTVILNK